MPIAKEMRFSIKLNIVYSNPLLDEDDIKNFSLYFQKRPNFEAYAAHQRCIELVASTEAEPQG